MAVRHKNRDTPTWVIASAAPVVTKEGRILAAVATFSDITAVVETQEQLEEAITMLEEQAAEVKSQAKEMQDQNERLLHLAQHLAAEQARLRATLAALPVAVVIADAEGNLVEQNDRFFEIWGAEAPFASSVGGYGMYKGWWVASGKPLAAEDWPLSRALRQGEVTGGAVIDIERFDGTGGTILNSAAPIRDKTGQISGAVAVMQDISERRRIEAALQENEAWLATILAQLPVGVGVVGPEGEFVLSNAIMRSYVSGNKMPAFDPERRAQWQALAADGNPLTPDQWPGPRALRGESVMPGIEFIYTSEAGRQSWRLLSAVPFRAAVIETGPKSRERIFRPEPDRVAGAIAVMQDITHRKQAEEALHRYTTELEALNQSNRTLLQEVNHRVKNTLSGILGLIYTERRLLQQREFRSTEESLDDLAQRVRSLAAAHTLLSESGWRPLDLDTLVGEVLAATAPIASDMPLLLEVRPSSVRVSPEQAHHLALILGELTTNALKYGGSDAGLQIRVESEIRDGEIRLIYRDGGLGYPEQVLEGQGYSVGLGLVNTLVRISLRGTWKIRNDDGAVAEVCFPADRDLNRESTDER
jgi:PAS domain S-box-containing protein